MFLLYLKNEYGKHAKTRVSLAIKDWEYDTYLNEAYQILKNPSAHPSKWGSIDFTKYCTYTDSTAVSFSDT